VAFTTEVTSFAVRTRRHDRDVRVVRAGWSSASFLAYTGALMVLVAGFALLVVISGAHGEGAFAGFSVLFFAVAAACAIELRSRTRPISAGLFAAVSVGMFGVMVGAFFNWFGWLHAGSGPFSGFHWGVLGVEFLVLLAARRAIRVFRFPLLSAVVAVVGWYFVTDVLSSGGNWTAVVTLFVGIFLFLRGLVLDGGPRRAFGFWIHVVAGLTVGGAFLFWWHRSDGDWTLIILASLAYIGLGSAIRRSSYAVLGTVGLVLATGYFSLRESIPFFNENLNGSSSPWAAPLAFLCLGFFLVLLARRLWRRGEPVATQPA
jgi:hypothetical protein